MQRFDRITWNPNQLNGQPCIRGMRLTVRRVVEAVALYPDRADLFRNYPELQPEDIKQGRWVHRPTTSRTSNRQARLDLQTGFERLSCAYSLCHHCPDRHRAAGNRTLPGLFWAWSALRSEEPPKLALDDPEFAALLAFLTEAKLLHGNSFEVLTDGPCFYEAELAAIAQARSSINLEAYIFNKGRSPSVTCSALAERARAGVRVRLTLDFIGSFSTPRSYLKELLDAGGELRGYHPLRIEFIPEFNNRTHRELLILDGTTAFVGGRGIADWWLKDGVRGTAGAT